MHSFGAQSESLDHPTSRTPTLRGPSVPLERGLFFLVSSSSLCSFWLRQQVNVEELLPKKESHSRSKGSLERVFLDLNSLCFWDNQSFGGTCLNAKKKKRNKASQNCSGKVSSKETVLTAVSSYTLAETNPVVQQYAKLLCFRKVIS